MGAINILESFSYYSWQLLKDYARHFFIAVRKYQTPILYVKTPWLAITSQLQNTMFFVSSWSPIICLSTKFYIQSRNKVFKNVLIHSKMSSLANKWNVYFSFYQYQYHLLLVYGPSLHEIACNNLHIVQAVWFMKESCCKSMLNVLIVSIV